ncbi:probable CDS1-CDP-diacylglycerol synthase [Zygosaccharomyces bailii ISA1307]|nr:probable CDS1-CDP-diacylglycerol synthase [Zygosaccharomyces bailii ISA1307]
MSKNEEKRTQQVRKPTTKRTVSAKEPAGKSGHNGATGNKVSSGGDSGSSSAKQTEKESKKYNFLVRTLWTFVMIAGFFATLAAGHFWCIILILVCQITTFKECIAVTGASGRARNLPLIKTLNWYFLFTTIYFLEGKSLFRFFQPYFFEYKLLAAIASNHKFVCYCLYLLGFVVFVCSLRKGFLKWQFASLCVTHMTLLLVVFQAHLIIKNVLNGLFWFLVPCGLVIVNDISAYLCGITFGRTKLIEISPKKTLEGFLGAWIFTAGASLLLTRLLSPWMYLTCPVQDIRTNLFTPISCDLNPVFIPQDYRLPPIIFEKFGISVFTVKPIYFHALNLASFASLFAPFGGFFASGLKRTFQVKDFGQSIPGHGGITDRVDCQFIMGSFSNLYYETFISEHRITVETILSTILMNLSERQILQLINTLNLIFFRKNILSPENYDDLTSIYKSAADAITEI